MFLLVSRTSDGCPRYLSSIRNPILLPSLAPYTPTASAVIPPTNAAPLCLSSSRPENPFPTVDRVSWSSCIALLVSASIRASICRRITSSFALFSAILPSASAMDLARMSSRSCSAFCRSVSRRDC